MSKNKPQYWVVGASWGGHDDQADRFIENSVWMLGWEEGAQPELAKDIKIGDRIAIKKMKGRGQSEIRIQHIGVVKGVLLDISNIVCSVEWVATDLDRDVVSRGCYKSVHGPFEHDEWVEKVFCL